MGRLKQTERKSTGGLAPRKLLATKAQADRKAHCAGFGDTAGRKDVPDVVSSMEGRGTKAVHETKTTGEIRAPIHVDSPNGAGGVPCSQGTIVFPKGLPLKVKGQRWNPDVYVLPTGKTDRENERMTVLYIAPTLQSDPAARPQLCACYVTNIFCLHLAADGV